MPQPAARDAITFLKRVWRAQGSTGFVYLTWFDEDHDWHDQSYRIRNGRVRGLDALPAVNDLYFAPNVYSEPRRRKELTLSGRWLYADLDEADPRALPGYLEPSIAWQTSKDRYQCMWQLSERLAPDKLAELNQKVTYFTEADRGGWHLTKVLRVPHTFNTKYDKRQRVKLLWVKDRAGGYFASTIRSHVKDVQTPGTVTADLRKLKLPKESAAAIRRRYNGRLSLRARKLLNAKTPRRGERSERLWELENLLLDAGMTPEEALVVVRVSAYNKYKGQRREVKQLWTEILKAAATDRAGSQQQTAAASGRSSTARSRKKTSASSSTRSRTRRRRSGTSKPSTPEKPKRELTGYNSFMTEKLKKPGWLVQGVWSESAHGVLAGEAKTFKSVIATDLAVSVASGTPFLNHFNVPATGPVVVIQEENDVGEFQDRLRRIAFSRGLLGNVSYSNGHLRVTPDVQLPIGLLNNTGFDLTSKDDLLWLARECKRLKPALIVLDPFYLMTPGVDENSAHQVTPVLRNLLKIKQHYGVGLQIIHHYKKQNTMNPIHGAARMSGTGVFHRWFESAVYVEKYDDENPATVRLVPDHRGHAPQGAIRVTFDLGTDDDLYYGVQLHNAKADRADLHARLERLLSEKDEWGLSELRVAMGLSSSKPVRAMVKEHGHVMKTLKTGKPGRRPTVVRRISR